MMGDRNPMKDPAVAAKSTEARRLQPFRRSAEGRRAVADAARRRMLSPDNPMRDPATAAKVTRKQLASKPKSKTEAWFEELSKSRLPELEWVGDGRLLIGGKAPDFHLAGTKRVIEVCQKSFFNHGAPVTRTVEGYGLPRVRLFAEEGWDCMVVFMPSHATSRKVVPSGLLTALWFFSETGLSGVWKCDEWFPFEGSGVSEGSTT